MSRVCCIAGLFLALMTAPLLHARLPIDPAIVDIPTDLLPRSSVIFRGRVVDVKADAAGQGRFTATFAPDRWYRGTPKPFPALSFAYNQFALMGHDCIDFQPTTYWLVFATVAKDGALALVDDCYGALSVAARIGSNIETPVTVAMLESDFEAGVDDRDPVARLVSIQRLGNLKSPAAQTVLHHALDHSTTTEKPWIILAALRTGDVGVLGDAASVLRTWRLRTGGPQGLIALELAKITDPTAVPELISILRTAPDPFVRSVALQALGDKIRDPRALSAIADFLGNTDQSVNYNALVGVSNITHAPACSLHAFKEDDIPRITESCKAWWEAEGRLRLW
jgi:hypothetical protein